MTVSQYITTLHASCCSTPHKMCTSEGTVGIRQGSTSTLNMKGTSVCEIWAYVQKYAQLLYF